MEGKEPCKHVVRRRKLRWGRLFLVVFVMVAAIAAALYTGVKIYNLLYPPPVAATVSDETMNTDETLHKRINVLILGIDDGDSEDLEGPKRTDAMMVASFDPENTEVSLLSLPRDTGVKIPGQAGMDKINHAHVYGGVTLAKQTVSNLLRIPIHYYVRLNWKAFIDVIDLLGGIDIYVDDNMYYEDPYADLIIDIKRGFQHMDGETAGKYVRFRNDEMGDIGRVQRQQKFMKEVAKSFFNIGNLMKLPTLINTIDKHIETDMDTMTMLKAANSFKLFGGERVRSEMLYGKFADIKGVSYWQTSPADIERTLTELKIPHQKVK